MCPLAGSFTSPLPESLWKNQVSFLHQVLHKAHQATHLKNEMAGQWQQHLEQPWAAQTVRMLRGGSKGGIGQDSLGVMYTLE